MNTVELKREAILKTLHPAFRELDKVVAAYVDCIRESPNLDDDQLEQQLFSLGVEAFVVKRCIDFVPVAFGRKIVLELGVQVADTYMEHDLATDNQTERPLAEELEYVWATTVANIYRQDPGYGNAF